MKPMKRGVFSSTCSSGGLFHDGTSGSALYKNVSTIWREVCELSVFKSCLCIGPGGRALTTVGSLGSSSLVDVFVSLGVLVHR